MRNYLHLDSMITPKIITFIYWLMLLGIAFAGLAMLVSAFGMMKYQAMAGFGMLVLTPIALLFGALAARIGCETMIVLFKINEAAQDIRMSTTSKQGGLS